MRELGLRVLTDEYLNVKEGKGTKKGASDGEVFTRIHPAGVVRGVPYGALGVKFNRESRNHGHH